MTSPEAAPRTAAGRALLGPEPDPSLIAHWGWEERRNSILAIEAEAEAMTEAPYKIIAMRAEAAAGTALDDLIAEIRTLSSIPDEGGVLVRRTSVESLLRARLAGEAAAGTALDVLAAKIDALERAKAAVKVWLVPHAGEMSADQMQGYADVLALLDEQIRDYEVARLAGVEK